MQPASPGKILRRFVLDFLVEQALRRDPTVDGARRRMLAASFSIEPLEDLGFARKYRVVAAEQNENRRVYLFLFRRPCPDRAFRTTELCFRRTIAVLRNGDAGLPAHRRDLLVPERLLRHRVIQDVGLAITETVSDPPAATRILSGSLVADVPKSLLTLGIIEVYPKGSLAGTRRESPTRKTKKRLPAADRPPGTISVEDWLRRAYQDTFGSPPVHISLADPTGPVYVVRVLGVTPKHEEWALEVTRHLRVREGAIKLEVRLLDVH